MTSPRAYRTTYDILFSGFEFVIVLFLAQMNSNEVSLLFAFRFFFFLLFLCSLLFGSVVCYCFLYKVCNDFQILMALWSMCGIKFYAKCIWLINNEKFTLSCSTKILFSWINKFGRKLSHRKQNNWL